MDVPSPRSPAPSTEIKVVVGDKVSEGDRRRHASKPPSRREPAPTRRRQRSRSAEHAAPEPAERARAAAGRRRGLRQPVRAPAGARAGHRPLERQGLRPRRADHARRTSRRRPRPGQAPRPPVVRAPATSASQLSRIKKISGPRLQEAWQTIPHVTQHDEADITDLEAFRKQVNAEQDVEGDDGRAADEGVRRVAEGVPGGQLVARRRRADPQALLPPRLRGGHAERAARPGHPATSTARACSRSPPS